jgi:hypothetical protein
MSKIRITHYDDPHRMADPRRSRIFAFIRRLSPVDRITAAFMALERPVKRLRALAITGRRMSGKPFCENALPL